MATCGQEVIIHAGNFAQYQKDQIVNGDQKSRGCITRNYNTHPQGCYKSAPVIDPSFQLIDQGEWANRIADKVAAQSQISDIRMRGNNGNPIPSLDQNGKGYCWAHSTTGAVMMLRALMNEPYVALSAYAVACVIKNYRDEGGWGAESCDFIVDKGVPSEAFWPMRSMSRNNDTPMTWANAAQHKIVEGFWDMAAAQYDRKLAFNQVVSLLLSDIPVVGDFNWWSHSVCLLDAVNGSSTRHMTRVDSGKLASTAEFDAIWGMNDPVTAGTGIRILNSWGDSWSDRGMGILTGSQAIPDGSVAPRAVLAAAA